MAALVCLSEAPTTAHAHGEMEMRDVESRLQALLVVLVLLGTLAVGCGRSDESAHSSSPTASLAPTPSPSSEGTPPDGPQFDESSGTPPLWQAKSLDTLVSRYPIVLVGTINRLVATHQQQTLMPDGSQLSGPPISVYSVTVQRQIASPTATIPTSLLFGQGGGYDQSGTAWWLDTLPTLGSTYLFFLQDLSQFRGEANYYSGPFFARFAIDKENRIVPNGWDATPGIGAVSGASSDSLAGIPTGAGKEAFLRSLAHISIDEAARTIGEAAGRVTPMPPPTRIATPTIAPAPAPAASTAP